eukprot:IDg8968t1
MEKLTAQRNNLRRYLYYQVLFVVYKMRTGFNNLEPAREQSFDIYLMDPGSKSSDGTALLRRPIFSVPKASTLSETITEGVDVTNRLTQRQLLEYRRELREKAVYNADAVNKASLESMIADYCRLNVELRFSQILDKPCNESSRKRRQQASLSTRSVQSRSPDAVCTASCGPSTKSADAEGDDASNDEEEGTDASFCSIDAL